MFNVFNRFGFHVLRSVLQSIAVNVIGRFIDQDQVQQHRQRQRIDFCLLQSCSKVFERVLYVTV